MNITELPVWGGVIVDLVFFLAITIFAINYNFIWYDILQRFEPFTLEFARVAQKRPWLFYGIAGILACLAIFAAVAIDAWYLRVIHTVIVGFFGWFIPHVAQYANDPNNPPHKPQWFAWAAKDQELKYMGHRYFERRINSKR